MRKEKPHSVRASIQGLLKRTRCLTFACVKVLKDVSLTIRLSNPLKQALERAAEKDRRSLSQLVGLALEQFLESRHEWPPADAKREAKRSARRR